MVLFLQDWQDFSISFTENNLRDWSLYPNRQEFCRKNNIPAKFGPSCDKADVNKLENYPQKLTNKLSKEDLTDGEPKAQVKTVVKENTETLKQCNKLADKMNQKKIRKTKQKHKHLKRAK